MATVGIHGDMAQERRSQILAGFLEEKYSAVVATGVLARGLDLKNVQQVTRLLFCKIYFTLHVLGFCFRYAFVNSRICAPGKAGVLAKVLVPYRMTFSV